ncbi:hypothetical protein T03_6871 [Trichinella britovi]|uniref:Uncharacterized protein n=1 Tax=Trichinella britovi TaxID=45882 RepID=A0A0V1C684_TRIBR|nr:hypothetical protein T03_6871 [Trichinella britovi]
MSPSPERLKNCSVAEAQTLVYQLSSLFTSGGFRLRKWARRPLRPPNGEEHDRGRRPALEDRDEDYLTFVHPDRSPLRMGTRSDDC